MSHVRLSDHQDDIHSTRVGTGAADLVIGCDVIVSASRPLAEWNEQSHAAVEAALARDYRPVFGTPRNDYRAVVYLRNDRPFRR